MILLAECEFPPPLANETAKLVFMLRQIRCLLSALGQFLQVCTGSANAVTVGIRGSDFDDLCVLSMRRGEMDNQYLNVLIS